MAAFVRVSIKGTLPGNDEWSINPVFIVGDGSEPPVSNEQANTICNAIAALSVPSTMLAAMSGNTSLNTFRTEFRTSGSGTPLEALAESFSAAGTVGTGASTHPNQTAIVVSLLTAGAGASRRGRLYLPATGLALQATNARPTTVTVTSILGGVKTYLSSINSAITATIPGGRLAVWSRKSGAALFNVTSLRMGDVVDTQRRRRDQLVESYSSVSYP